MKYKYKALNTNNEIVEEFILLNSEKEVLKYLKNLHLRPIKISIVEDTKIKKIKLKKEKLGDIFYKLHILTSSNITLPNAISIISKNENKKEKLFADFIIEMLEDGSNLSDILKYLKSRKIIINMVEVGENSSNLPKTFKNLSDYYRSESKFEREIKSAMYYPILLIVISFILVNFLIIFIMPSFLDMFYENRESLPFITRFLIKFAEFLNSYFVIINITIFLFIIFMFLYLKTENGKRVFDKIKLKFKLYKKIITKKYISMMHLLIESDITVAKSINIIASSFENIIFQEKLLKVEQDLNNGISLSKSLEDNNLFDKTAISLIETAEEASAMKKILNTMNEYYDYEVKNYQKNFITFFEPLTIVVLALIVGFVIISISVPMFDVVNRV
ncbi:type II secretion system F family protein [Peptoniphilus stercorisuis]|uniref:Type IV pilus assembly protein PilC n=1 Tax=Peptoniphilus stercorisuis TaxID=1436965 RepID=A0ABS4KBK5_9FIRM|nr:type II secretion system F family protein [Peptoniphilus stercorisuis]MBP2025154.1 type IV pilus assembly protein PilC [Peptoniphilus stercorisuis]